LAKNLAEPSTSDLDLPPNLGGCRARIDLPYPSGIYRFIRMLGLVTLLASSLGLLAAVAGFPINWVSMLLALVASLVLIGFSVRPSLRKPKF